MKKVSVVIVNYNVKDLVLTSLRTLFSFHPNTDLEVIVVDNDSKDGSCEAIDQEFPQVILIRNKFNAGFPKANNQGFEISTGDYIFMLNPDTEFLENAIDTMVGFLEKSDEYALLAPKLLNADLSLQRNAWRYPSLASVFCESFYLKFFLKKKNYLEHSFNEPFQGESFSGAALFFRKEVFQKIGMLDEAMFWIEDVEFCFRLTEKGLKCLFFPDSKIIHHIGQSAKKNYNISISNQIFNKIKFFDKHKGKFQTLLVKCLSFLHVIFKIVLFGLLAPFKAVYFRKWKAYLYTLPKVFNPPKGIA